MIRETIVNKKSPIRGFLKTQKQIIELSTSKVTSISVSPPASSKPVFGLVGSCCNVNVNDPELAAPVVRM